jgi:hypothetical protein
MKIAVEVADRASEEDMYRATDLPRTAQCVKGLPLNLAPFSLILNQKTAAPSAIFKVIPRRHTCTTTANGSVMIAKKGATTWIARGNTADSPGGSVLNTAGGWPAVGQTASGLADTTLPLRPRTSLYR